MTIDLRASAPEGSSTLPQMFCFQPRECESCALSKAHINPPGPRQLCMFSGNNPNTLQQTVVSTLNAVHPVEYTYNEHAVATETEVTTTNNVVMTSTKLVNQSVAAYLYIIVFIYIDRISRDVPNVRMSWKSTMQRDNQIRGALFVLNEKFHGRNLIQATPT